MSQIYKNSTSSSPTIPTSFTTDVRNNTTTSPGTAIPSGNNLQVLGGTSVANTSNGIRTDANPNNDKFVYVELTNRVVGSVTTTGAALANVVSLDLSAAPLGTSGVYTFDITIAGFAKTGIGVPLGCGFTIVGAVRYDGVSATLIPTQVVDHFEEGTLGTPTQVQALLDVSGTSAVVTVTGKTDGAAGFVIDWVGTMLYTFAS